MSEQASNGQSQDDGQTHDLFLPVIQPQWVTSPEQLQERIASWLTQDILAIDTEFMRTRTYYAIPGLIQIADQHGAYLIDPLLVPDLRPLGELLRAPGPLKVMHSMTEDILLLHRITGELPVHIYDTQVAETFLGATSSLGFQRFVQERLGVLLDKNETRSDWLARPLSEEQILYAAQDVVFLLEAVKRQMPSIREKGLYDHVLEECDAWVQQIYSNEVDLELSYLKVRGAWELNRLQQCILKHLVMFRDQRARDKDVPRNWICEDHVLTLIARRAPESMGDMRAIRGVPDSTVRRFGEPMVALVQAIASSGIEGFEVIERPVFGHELDIYKKMKRLVEHVAEQTGFSTGLLGPKKQIELLLIQVVRKKDPTLTPFFQGWRKSYVGNALLAQLLESPPPSSRQANQWKRMLPE